MEVDNERPAESFRDAVEKTLEGLQKRVEQLETLSDSGNTNSPVGLLRTFETRISQVETVQAENTSSILRLGEHVTKSLEGQANAIVAIGNDVKALKPAQ